MAEHTFPMVSSHSRRHRGRLTIASLVLPAALVVCLGCGGGEGERYRVSGAITLDGVPIPNGMITFEPDFQKGNTGPQGIALIRDGRFDTSTQGGRGIVGGPHRVRIEGYRSEAVPPELADPSAPTTVEVLISNFETEVDFPQENTTHDFTITSDALRVTRQNQVSYGP